MKFTVISERSFFFQLQKNAKFTVVPERPLMFLPQNTKLQNTKFLKLFPTGHLRFSDELKNLKVLSI